jgi:hypothetical protein
LLLPVFLGLGRRCGESSGRAWTGGSEEGGKYWYHNPIVNHCVSFSFYFKGTPDATDCCGLGFLNDVSYSKGDELP